MTRPLLDIIVEHVGQPMPEGCDAWGMRSVHPDLRSSLGFRWPWPGQWAEAPGPILDHHGPCPLGVGDGLCVALTPSGMASGGIPAITVLLTAHASADALGGDADKLRVRRTVVIELVDLPGLAQDSASLSGAHLSGAHLSGADLGGANLSRANLSRADLRGANLHGAGLSWADLSWADLSRADLSRADLRWADLSRADLRWADLRGANLRGANLTEANPTGAVR